nr:lef-8 [Ectropis obliqua nucleopolyhedrovirus]
MPVLADASYDNAVSSTAMTKFYEKFAKRQFRRCSAAHTDKQQKCLNCGRLFAIIVWKRPKTLTFQP